MREIKFRAWDSENNCKKLSVGIMELFDDMLAFRFEHFEQDPENIVFEQFTGLHDKNGREIYEGDVVRIARYGGELQTHGEISEEKGAFCVRNGYAVAETDILGQFKPEIIEVIGNIHENQELLK